RSKDTAAFGCSPPLIGLSVKQRDATTSAAWVFNPEDWKEPHATVPRIETSSCRRNSRLTG
ncbi:hypothetical protein AAVH_12525, partial [Aphelenchoides avenae]